MSTNLPLSTEPVAPTLSATEMWLEKNFKKVLILCGAAIVAAAIYGVIRYRTEAVAREAALAFTAADTTEGFDAVVSQFPGSVAAGNALLAKAELLWEKNQKDSSTDALKKFLADYRSHPLTADTKLALASRLEAMGDKAEAKKLFEELISQHAESPLAPLAEIRLGDLLWDEGKLDEAKAIYSALPSKYPGTNQPFFDQSQDRLKWIGAALPTKEVDAPKPPPAPEAPPAAAATKPGTVTLPPINLGAGQNPQGMSVTVTPEGGVVTPPVKVEAAPAPAKPAPATPAAEAPKTPAPAKPAPAADAPVKPTPATEPSPVKPAPATEAVPAKPAPAPAADAPAKPAPAPEAAKPDAPVEPAAPAAAPEVKP